MAWSEPAAPPSDGDDKIVRRPHEDCQNKGDQG